MRDVLLFSGCWLFAAIFAAAVFHRIKTRRPYLAARWNTAENTWADAPATSPADLDALELLWAMPAYSGDDHTTTNPTGDQTP